MNYCAKQQQLAWKSRTIIRFSCSLHSRLSRVSMLRFPTGQPVLYAASRKGALDAVRGRGHARRGVMGVGLVQGSSLPFPLVTGQQPGNRECPSSPSLSTLNTLPRTHDRRNRPHWHTTAVFQECCPKKQGLCQGLCVFKQVSSLCLVGRLTAAGFSLRLRYAIPVHEGVPIPVLSTIGYLLFVLQA